MASSKSFCLDAKNNHQKATIKLYQISVYGLSELHQTSNGLIKAKINEKNNNVLDLYTSEVTTANTVLNINNKNVIQVESILLSTLSPIKYLPDNITK